MNPNLDRLQPYPFQRLKALCSDITPADNYTPIDLSIGEPKHSPPAFVLEALTGNLGGVSKYPPTPGSPELREIIAAWASQRFSLPENTLTPQRHVLPVNGTREALFAVAQCLFDSTSDKRLIVMPNPFYQIYEGAALLAGAQPWFYNTPATLNYQPDIDNIDAEVWQQCQMVYLCTPGNPSGAVVPQQTLQRLIELSVEHNFIIISDECYSEIYPDENTPPIGLLQAAASMGNTGYRNCLVFNSLSKRSNLPGLRSGFVAGQAELIAAFLLYRTYHGSAMPVHTDAASRAAWSDESHVTENRQRYREKYDAVLDVLQAKLNVVRPDAGFFLWPQISVSDTEFTRSCLIEKNVKVLPGSYLSRATDGDSPGAGQIRMALVAPKEQCVEAAQRIADLLPG
ncbi:MAG: succinyldiaminopimelate transaminase [Pseudomonadota bacterium]